MADEQSRKMCFCNECHGQLVARATMYRHMRKIKQKQEQGARGRDGEIFQRNPFEAEISSSDEDEAQWLKVRHSYFNITRHLTSSFYCMQIFSKFTSRNLGVCTIEASTISVRDDRKSPIRCITS